jgi:hypothetical protein
MTTMNLVEPRLAWFVEEMRAKLALPRNQAKGEWRNNSEWGLLFMLRDEVNELEQIMDSFAMGETTEAEVIKECADVAGFAMMLADWYNARK